jgi:site-specific DNA recombinase
MRKVEELPLKRSAETNRKKVAAYARVSTGKDAMLHSLSAQVSYYSRLIQQRADWEYIGVYADEGISGTKENRENFQRMLEDARLRKIDLILTKSISRFARNTLLLLETVRELKDLSIAVYFEREKINSLTADGELMLSLLASFAQEECLSARENSRWSIKKRFEKGEIVGMAHLYGYDYIDGRLVINDEEAEIVRMIYRDYLSAIQTPFSGIRRVSPSSRDDTSATVQSIFFQISSGTGHLSALRSKSLFFAFSTHSRR